MGFSLSLPSQEIPTKMGFFTPFTYEPSSSQCLQKTSPFHCALGHCDFLGLCSCRSFGMFLEDCNLKKGCSLCLKLQLGRINEICGQEAYSKTNLALHIIKEAQIKSVELMSVAT
ncbi:hypothetical protein CMV_027178 [Castanea mollissima]|uniref:Uncharacterized protein n=1 Tax=Castanea mollissima TaxID=60419 RepID=A0A8J4QKB1_9ROSI|nr:hypothetical protein CMV_027178 [Castanea mollissima]